MTEFTDLDVVLAGIPDPDPPHRLPAIRREAYAGSRTGITRVRPEPTYRPLDAEVFDNLLHGVRMVVASEGAASLDALTACTNSLADVVGALQGLAAKAHRFAVPVNALPRPDVRLVRPPLWVSVEQDDDEHFVAEVAEVGAVGYGDTVADAVDGAVSSLCEIYDQIASAPSESLGPRPARWRQALRALTEPLRG